MIEDIHPEPLAQFTTTGECQVTLSRYDDGSVLAYFQVEHGDIATALLDADKNIVVQRASVQFDPASLASLREAITEHVWTSAISERAGEISLQCLCGLMWKHIPVKRGQTVEIPRCPQEGQPSEEEKLVRLLTALPETTERGFRYVEIPFRDYQGSPERHLSVQESSLATEDRLWVGFDTVMVDLNGGDNPEIQERGHLDAATVRKLRDTLTAWLDAD